MAIRSRVRVYDQLMNKWQHSLKYYPDWKHYASSTEAEPYDLTWAST